MEKTKKSLLRIALATIIFFAIEALIVQVILCVLFVRILFIVSEINFRYKVLC